MLSTIARRTVARAAPRAARNYASEVQQTANAFVAERAAIEAHAGETMELWRRVSYYVCIPAIIVGGIWTYKVEKEHAEHVAHEKEANGGELPAIPEYEFLNRRVKPFPWGNNALFFNPETNKDMNAAAEE